MRIRTSALALICCGTAVLIVAPASVGLATAQESVFTSGTPVASKLSKAELFRIVSRAGWSQERLVALLGRHFSVGGEPFSLSISEIQKMRLYAVADEVLDLIMQGPVSERRTKAILTESERLRDARHREGRTKAHRGRHAQKTVDEVQRKLEEVVCGPGMVVGCGKFCAPPKRLGDGVCNDFFDCREHKFDHGDCDAAVGMKFHGRFVLLDTSLVVSDNEAETTMEGDLAVGFGQMLTPNLHVGGAVRFTGTGGDKADMGLHGRVGYLVELDAERSSFLDLRASVGWRFSEVGVLVVDLAPGVLVAFGEQSGGLLRFGVGLSIAYADGATASSFSPNMAFGGHF